MGGRGSQEGGRVGDPFNDLLIYTDFILEGGVRGTGSDESGSNSFDTQAPGIPRRLLPSSEAIVQVTCSIQVRAKGRYGGGNKRSQVQWRGKAGTTKSKVVHYNRQFVLCVTNGQRPPAKHQATLRRSHVFAARRDDKDTACRT